METPTPLPSATVVESPTTSPTVVPPGVPRTMAADPFARWNSLEPQDWWRESEPYSCLSPAKETSPWMEAGMTDLGGSDQLSLIRFHGNGSYLRYGFMGFEGCTPIEKYSDRTHLDPPVDPAYYSLGDLDIAVDIARVPPDAPGWFEDDGARETMGMAEAVNILNTHVAAYFEKISEGRLRMRFQAGTDFKLGGEGSPNDVQGQQLRLAGVMDCRGQAADRYPCDLGAPGGLNRLLLTDVTTDRGRRCLQRQCAYGTGEPARSQHGSTGARDGPCLDELAPLLCRGPVGRRGSRNPQSVQQRPGLHVRALVDADARLASGHAFDPRGEPLHGGVDRPVGGRSAPERIRVVHAATASGEGLPDARHLIRRRYAFTTVEVLDERNPSYKDELPKVYAPTSERPFHYDGVLVSRYDQSTGTGIHARFGPALYDERNPDVADDVNWGRDDFSVMQDGETRDIGGGVRLQVYRNQDGSYEVSVSGGQTAEFQPWCATIWFAFGEYDAGCALDKGGGVSGRVTSGVRLAVDHGLPMDSCDARSCTCRMHRKRLKFRYAVLCVAMQVINRTL